MWTLSSNIVIPICGFKLVEPLILKSKPKPVEPIVLLSQIITLFPIKEFFITTLFLIIEFLSISTPLAMTQLWPIWTVSCILEYFDIYDPLIKLNLSRAFELSSW